MSTQAVLASASTQAEECSSSTTNLTSSPAEERSSPATTTKASVSPRRASHCTRLVGPNPQCSSRCFRTFERNTLCVRARPYSRLTWRIILIPSACTNATTRPTDADLGRRRRGSVGCGGPKCDGDNDRQFRPVRQKSQTTHLSPRTNKRHTSLSQVWDASFPSSRERRRRKPLSSTIMVWVSSAAISFLFCLTIAFNLAADSHVITFTVTGSG